MVRENNAMMHIQSRRSSYEVGVGENPVDGGKKKKHETKHTKPIKTKKTRHKENTAR